MQRFLAVLASLVVVGGALFTAIASGGVANPSDGPSGAPATIDTGSAIVLLKGEPLSTDEKTRPPKGKKIDFSSSSVKSYRAQLASVRNDFKQWLRANAPATRVNTEFDVALNAVSVELNGTQLGKLLEAPQVASAQYQGLHRKAAEDADLALVSAPQAWAVGGGAANAGAGVKVAIIDSGIAIENPCFSDAGYAPQRQIGDTRFTNNKVIAAKVFGNKAKNSSLTPAPGEPTDQHHGTHVAGMAACNANTPAVVGGVLTYAMSGVAPHALLGNYNVFPGDFVEVRDEDLVDAMEEAYEDGFDVINMSIGGGSAGLKTLDETAVNNLDQAGVVVAVAAGNGGPGHFTVESPGKAERALTAGAATVGHFMSAAISAGGATFHGRPGDLATAETDVTGNLAVLTAAPTNSATGLSTACDALPAGSLTGQIAVVSRGTCFFSVKARNAEAAGAAAIVIVNNIAGDPIIMGTDGLASQPEIPAYMVSLSEGLVLKTKTGSATVSAALSYFFSGNNDKISDFSGQGPTNVDFRVKPDLVAPGENIISSWPAKDCAGVVTCFGFMQGTSMASPHLAGAAAVVLSTHPAWSSAQVRSAIVNSADEGTLRHWATFEPLSDPLVNGAGRLNVLSAVNAKVALDPVSVSFGAVPSGSGQTRMATVTLSRLASSGPITASVSPSTGTGVEYSVSQAGDVLTVTMTAAKDAGAGDHSARLSVSQGGVEVAHAVVYTLVK